jgi:SAM-dependent methyltransferase
VETLGGKKVLSKRNLSAVRLITAQFSKRKTAMENDFLWRAIRIFMSNTVERFSNRVENYVKYRPGYPPEIRELFRDEMNLKSDSDDCRHRFGNGNFRQNFSRKRQRGFRRRTERGDARGGGKFSADFPNFKSVDGTAENTNLPDNSVDFVVAAQAFHWFDREKTRAELKRILRPDGFVGFDLERTPARHERLFARI